MNFLTKKRVLVLTGLIALVLILYFFMPSGTPAGLEQVTEVQVKKDTLKISMEADGKSEVSNIKLRFGINGVLEILPVKPGDTVKKGDTIARLDTRNLEYEVASARANYQAALAKLENTESQLRSQVLAELNKLNNARSQWEKDKKEYTSMLGIAEVFSRQEIELKKLALDNSQKNNETAKESYNNAKNNSTGLETASVSQARAALDKALKNLQDAELKAPCDGVILTLNYKIGETVSTNNDFAVITDGQGIKVNAAVLEMDIKDVYLGQRAEVELESIPSQIFTGKVTYIDTLPVNDPNGVVAYNVEISLDEPEASIKSGSSCLVTFVIKQKKDVLIIPNDAIKMINGKQTVEIKDKEGSLAQRQVKAGFTDGTNVEVIKGLQLNETVVVRKPVKTTGTPTDGGK